MGEGGSKSRSATSASEVLNSIWCLQVLNSIWRLRQTLNVAECPNNTKLFVYAPLPLKMPSAEAHHATAHDQTTITKHST